MKIAPIEYGDRKVFSVSAFNRGVADWLARLPTVWVEGEVTELRRQQAWQSVFFTLKDPSDGSCLAVTMPRGQFDALRLDLVDGERVHVYGRPELYEQRGDFHLRALSIERYGLGAHLAALERLKQKLAAEGLFAADRKRRLPRFPRLIGLVTGNDAAAKPSVPVAPAVGHEQDTPLCDLAADVRASTPSVAGRLVVPDLGELRAWLDRAHEGLGRGARRVVDRHRQQLDVAHERLRRAPLLALERRTARLDN